MQLIKQQWKTLRRQGFPSMSKRSSEPARGWSAPVPVVRTGVQIPSGGSSQSSRHCVDVDRWWAWRLAPVHRHNPSAGAATNSSASTPAATVSRSDLRYRRNFRRELRLLSASGPCFWRPPQRVSFLGSKPLKVHYFSWTPAGRRKLSIGADDCGISHFPIVFCIMRHPCRNYGRPGSS